MAFGLVALGIATFIELKSKSALVLASAEKINSYIDGKVMAEINDLQPDVRRKLTVFTNGHLRPGGGFAGGRRRRSWADLQDNPNATLVAPPGSTLAMSTKY